MNFKVTHYANVGVSEPWVARIMVGLPQLLEATKFDPSEKEQIRDAIALVSDELHAAHLSLIQLRGFDKMIDPPMAEVKTAYHNLYDHLWQAYKERLQYLTKKLGANEPDFNLAFLFSSTDKDAPFDNGVRAFVAKRPQLFQNLEQALRQDRATWHGKLGKLRDGLQHKGEHLSKGIFVEVEDLYLLNSAEIIFTNVWQRIEQLVVLLIGYSLYDPFVIVYAPDDVELAKQNLCYYFLAPGLSAVEQ